MTARTLTAPQRRALLWLAERPGEWRVPEGGPKTAFIEVHRILPSLVEMDVRGRAATGLRRLYRTTRLGLEVAKELGA